MAKLKLDQLRPTRATVAAFAGLLWAVSFGAVRDFVWADIRAGLIDLRGLSRATRALVWFGLLLLAVMIGALLFNDTLRSQTALIAMTDSVAGRGSLLPVALLPLTLFMLSVAWGFLLTGALHSRPLVRVALLVLYLLFSSLRVFLLVSSMLGATNFLDVNLWLGIGAWLAVPLFFLLRWRAQPNPIFEFTMLFAVVAVSFSVSQTTGVENWRLFGIPLTLAELQANIQLPSLVILPLLVFFGIDVANFARRSASWVVNIVTQRMVRWALWVALATVFAWRLWTVLTDAAQRSGSESPSAALLTYASALAVPLLVAVMWWITSRTGAKAERPEPDEVGEAAERAALPLITVYIFASFIVTFAAGATAVDVGGLVVSIAAFAATFWFLRRGQHGTAVFMGVFSALSIWREATKPGAVLGALDLGYGSTAQAPVDFWWVIGLALITLWWLARRELTADRAARLLFLLLITEMVRQTSFIESPFSPFLGFAGIGFIAFGLVWDVVTKGFWTNRSTPALPRVSRLFLYLGYVLFTATLINWTLTSHNLAELDMFTGNLANVGFGRFGKPLLYAILVAILAQPAMEEKSEHRAQMTDSDSGH